MGIGIFFKKPNLLFSSRAVLAVVAAVVELAQHFVLSLPSRYTASASGFTCTVYSASLKKAEVEARNYPVRSYFKSC